MCVCGVCVCLCKREREREREVEGERERGERGRKREAILSTTARLQSSFSSLCYSEGGLTYINRLVRAVFLKMSIF